jgi:hypothetical protein
MGYGIVAPLELRTWNDVLFIPGFKPSLIAYGAKIL